MSKSAIPASPVAWCLALVVAIGGCFGSPEPSRERVYELQAPELYIGLEVEGPPIQVVVHDTHGLLRDVRAATKTDATRIAEWPAGVFIQAAALDGSSRTVLIEWIGVDCDTVAITLRGDPVEVLVVTQSTGCDAIPSFRGVVLDLIEPVSLPLTLEIRSILLGEG